jgi:flagellar basal-body rod protein FlgB
MRVFDSTLATLERALDVRLARQNVLAGNIANADTPGYQPQDVDVEAAMAQPASPSPQPTAGEGMRLDTSARLPLVPAQGAAAGIDGNAVDLDRTMVALAQNALQYTAVAKAAGKKLAILRYVASDGAA